MVDESSSPEEHRSQPVGGQDAPEDDGGKLPAEHEGSGEATRSRPTFRPRCDIMETEEGLTMLADMPGAKAQTLQVDLERRALSIRAEVEDHAPDGMSPILREYVVGDWERRFQLSGEVDTDGIEANLKDGVLTLRVLRARQPEARRIEVGRG